jgi:hypothetical protein
MFPDAPRRDKMPPMSAIPQPAYPVPPPPTPADRVRAAWQRRSQTDYIFDFWTALGWTILTCGIYAVYIVYQLMRRSRDHNLRRIELLDAATAFAWDQAQAKGLAEELRPNFERIAPPMAVLRNETTKFRDPTIWLIIAIVARGVAEIVSFILLDGDLITHDHAEGAIESELSAIYARLGAAVPPPDASRLKAPHNYVGRVIATIFSFGIYGFWWEYNVMTEGNQHFEHNWAWEDELAQSVQQLMAA